MAHFHFNFRQGETYTVDEEGCEFRNAEEAYLGAFNAAQDLWHEMLVNRQDPLLCAFEITDDEGRCLFTLPFGEVLDACRGRTTVPAQYHPSSAILQALENRRQARRAALEAA